MSTRPVKPSDEEYDEIYTKSTIDSSPPPQPPVIEEEVERLSYDERMRQQELATQNLMQQPIPTVQPNTPMPPPEMIVTDSEMMERFRASQEIDPTPITPQFREAVTQSVTTPSISERTSPITQEMPGNWQYETTLAQNQVDAINRYVGTQTTELQLAEREYQSIMGQKDLFTPESLKLYESEYTAYKSEALIGIAQAQAGLKALDLYKTQLKVFGYTPTAITKERMTWGEAEAIRDWQVSDAYTLQLERLNEGTVAAMIEAEQPSNLDKIVGAVQANPVGSALLRYESVVGAPSAGLRGSVESLFNIADVAKQSQDPLTRIGGLGAAIGAQFASIGAATYDFTTFIARPVLMAQTAYGFSMIGVGGVKALQGDSSMLKQMGAEFIGRGGSGVIGMIGGAALTPMIYNLAGKAYQRLRPKYQVNELLEMRAEEIGTVQDKIGDVSQRTTRVQGPEPATDIAFGESEAFELSRDVIRGEQSPLMKTELTGVSKQIPREVAELYPSELNFDTALGITKEGQPIAVSGISSEGIGPPKGAKLGEPWKVTTVEDALKVSYQGKTGIPGEIGPTDILKMPEVKGKFYPDTGTMDIYQKGSALDIYKEIGGAGEGGAGGSWSRFSEQALHPEAPTGEFKFSSGKLVEGKVGTMIEGWIERPSVGQAPVEGMFTPYDVTKPGQALPMGEPTVIGGVESIKPTEFTMDIKAVTQTPILETTPTKLVVPKGMGELGADLTKFPKTLATQPTEPVDFTGGTSLNKTFGYTPPKTSTPGLGGIAGEAQAVAEMVTLQQPQLPQSLAWVSKAAPTNIVGAEAGLLGATSSISGKITIPKPPTQPEVSMPTMKDITFQGSDALTKIQPTQPSIQVSKLATFTESQLTLKTVSEQIVEPTEVTRTIPKITPELVQPTIPKLETAVWTTPTLKPAEYASPVIIPKISNALIQKPWTIQRPITTPITTPIVTPRPIQITPPTTITVQRPTITPKPFIFPPPTPPTFKPPTITPPKIAPPLLPEARLGGGLRGGGRGLFGLEKRKHKLKTWKQMLRTWI